MKASHRPPSAAFHAITHVWGREYLDLFLSVCIPNQLAPGNIPALPPGSRYRILTRSIHVEELDSHPMVNALREVIPVDIVVVEALDRQMGIARGQDLMIACHQQAITEAMDADAAIIMLSADFVFSENALSAVVQRHREGYRAVINTGLRLAKEPFLQYLAESRAPLALSSRELVRMALPYLHPETQSMFADAPRFMAAPWAVYWRIGNEGLLVRCFSLHPLMVDAVVRKSLKGTNDGHFLSRACPDFSRVHVVTDSDELQMFELTTMNRKAGTCDSAGASVLRCAMMAAERDELQLDYWRRRDICLHATDLDQKWTAAASVAQKFVNRATRRRRYAKTALRWVRRIERIRGWSERQMKAWRRRRRPVTAKQIMRSLRLATHRSAKTLRKGTRQVFRHIVAR